MKPGPHIPPTHLRHIGRLQLTTFGDLFQWVPCAYVMDEDVLKFAISANRIGAIFNHFTYLLLEYVASSDDIYLCSNKIFLSLTTADNRRLACDVELSSTSQVTCVAGGKTSFRARLYNTYTASYAAGLLHRHAGGGQCPGQLMIRRYTFAHAAQVCRRHMRTRLEMSRVSVVTLQASWSVEPSP